MIIVVTYIIEYIPEKPAEIILSVFSQVFLSEVLNMHINKKKIHAQKNKKNFDPVPKFVV